MLAALQIVHPYVSLAAVILTISAAYFRWFYYKNTIIKFSFLSQLKKQVAGPPSYIMWVPFIFKLCGLLLLAVLVGRPQSVDTQSKVETEGIAIMLVLDASGSMRCFDDLYKRESRFTIARREAINFMQKRENDQIGLVFFGRDAVSRCPLTLDRHILRDCLTDITIGDINADGTVLSTAICMAARRLAPIKTVSKVMIVLTDGEPTPQLDLDPQLALEIAQKEGIKIYTIGIGSNQQAFIDDEFFGLQAVESRVNVELLSRLAEGTGGKFFMCQRTQDLNKIYQHIDQLEKTMYETPIYRNYQELVLPFALGACGMIGMELLMRTFIWFIV